VTCIPREHAVQELLYLDSELCHLLAERVWPEQAFGRVMLPGRIAELVV
jgi:hypothetical protein